MRNKHIITLCVLSFILGLFVCYFFRPYRYKLMFGEYICFKIDTITGRAWIYHGKDGFKEIPTDNKIKNPL